MTELKIAKQKNSTVDIEGEIPAEAFEAHRETAAAHLGRDIELPGFRKGNAPAHLVAERVGEARILEEMANRALGEHLPKLFTKHQIDPIGRPNITVTKLAPNNPLGFKLTTAVLPKVELPDYKAIAAKHNSTKEKVEVTDKDIDEALLAVRKRLKASETTTENKTDDTSDEKLPELTDDVVKKLGDFKDVAAFKAKLTEELTVHKTQLAREKKRAALLDEIVSATKTPIPDILVESELHKLVARFKEDVARVGAKWEEYLKQIKKTEDGLRKEWRGDAEKNAKTQLVLNEIAKQETIRPDEARVNKEVGNILAEHPEANATGQASKLDKTSVTIYVQTILTNQKVFEFLEQQKA